MSNTDFSLAARALKYPGWWFVTDTDSAFRIWVVRPSAAFEPLLLFDGAPWIGYTMARLVEEGEIAPD